MMRINGTLRANQAGNRAGRGLCAVLAMGLASFVSVAAAPAPIEAVDQNPAEKPPPALTDVETVILPVPGLQNELQVKSMIARFEELRGRYIAPAAGAEIATPINAYRARFDLLPNWDMGQNAVRLLPNFDGGTVPSLLIEQGFSFPATVMALESTTTPPPTGRYDR